MGLWVTLEQRPPRHWKAEKETAALTLTSKSLSRRFSRGSLLFGPCLWRNAGGRDASGPGMVLAGMSLGKLLTPRVVDRIESSGRSDAVGAMWAALGVAVLLYAFTISTPLLSDVPELAVWVLIGIGFGALRATVISMNEGAAVTAMPKDMAMEGMAVLAMAVSFTSPVAAFSWGWSIQQIGAIPTVFIGATLMVISLVLLRLLFLRTVASTEASPY